MGPAPPTPTPPPPPVKYPAVPARPCARVLALLARGGGRHVPTPALSAPSAGSERGCAGGGEEHRREGLLVSADAAAGCGAKVAVGAVVVAGAREGGGAAGAEAAALVRTPAGEQGAAVSAGAAHRALTAGHRRASVSIATEERSGRAGASERGARAEAAARLVRAEAPTVRARHPSKMSFLNGLPRLPGLRQSPAALATDASGSATSRRVSHPR